MFFLVFLSKDVSLKVIKGFVFGCFCLYFVSCLYVFFVVINVSIFRVVGVGVKIYLFLDFFVVYGSMFGIVNLY